MVWRCLLDQQYGLSFMNYSLTLLYCDLFSYEVIFFSVALLPGTTQDHLQIFNIETKMKVKSHQMPEQVIFYECQSISTLRMLNWLFQSFLFFCRFILLSICVSCWSQLLCFFCRLSFGSGFLQQSLDWLRKRQFIIGQLKVDEITYWIYYFICLFLTNWSLVLVIHQRLSTFHMTCLWLHV